MPESQCRVLEAEGARGLRGARGREMPNCACTSCRLSILALRKRKWLLNHVRLFVTLWTVAHQAPLSMGFSKQEYWSGLPFPSPGDFSDPGIKAVSPALQADALSSEPSGKPLHRKSTPHGYGLVWRSNQSILKEISLECSLEGLMLKLKLQYFGYLMRRTDSFEKALMQFMGSQRVRHD